jgi:hypothetical protein
MAGLPDEPVRPEEMQVSEARTTGLERKEEDHAE